jgi:lysine-N-methylase
MCIDSDSLNAYKNDQSSFAPTLKSGINFKKSKFKADKKMRCAFLNNKGLCEIIINLGEKSLCQVCRDHPRFRSFLGDTIEMGLGFCCEEATRFILTFPDKIERILVSEDKAETELDLNQKFIVEFRQNALDIVQDRTTVIDKRMEKLLTLCKVDLSKLNHKKIVNTFLSFERLDKSWTNRLKSIRNQKLLTTTPQNLSHFCEQFLSNGLYRHVLGAEDTMSARARVVALIISWWIIQTLLEKEQENEQPLSRLIDLVRAFSSEVEYSDKNLNKLFSSCYKLIKL